MKPPPFDYVAPTSLDEALAALADHGDEAKVLAGGQSLIPLMSLRLAHPTVLVDVNGVDELKAIERVDGTLRIGAMVRHRAAERSKEVADAVPLIRAVMPLIGHVAIRSRGTVGGSLAHADPAAELPAVALALGATFTVRSRARGERTIDASDFFGGYFTTAIEPDEILTAIDFPVLEGGVAVEEVARRHGDFAMVGAVVATPPGDTRIALINVAERPVRATAAEAALDQGAGLDEVAALVSRDIEPSADLHASAAYRKKVAGVCVKRALAKAMASEGSNT
ncbi:MAG TPA: xanthine dehydrogenase family protein subunit M [Acidimicrobiales bacterium]|nr:xanthine dehydrogenase family protein subunit M [Acidimicrobiales bacterium]